MSMKALRTLKEMLENEIDEIAEKRKLNAGDIDAVAKMIDIVCDIDCKLRDDDGYSNDGEWRADMRGSYGRDDHARRGERYTRGYYSRDDGRESMIRKLEAIMRDETGDRRETISHAIDELRNA